MSFLNWAGGKTKVLPHLVAHIPTRMNDYLEPFLGGGSVLLYVLNEIEGGRIHVTGKIRCADINRALILCYQAVKKYPEDVIRVYENLGTAHDQCPEKAECKKKSSICLCKECFYFAARTCFNAFLKTDIADTMLIDIGAYFLFLNGTCYRGLYRESKAGVMNSCYWTSRTITLKSHEVRDASHLFRKYNVQFVHSDFRDFLTEYAERNDAGEPPNFVFFDPPYVPLKQTNLISNEYNKDGFGDDDTIDLIHWIREHKDTTKLTFCNHYSEKLFELCGEWEVRKTYDVRRSLKYCGASALAEEMLVSNVG